MAPSSPTRRPRLAMCEATLHGHTGLSVSSNFQKDQLPQRRSVSKETWRLSLISLFEMTNFLTKTDDVHLASRSARRSRSFLRHPPASSPPCLPLPFPSRVAESTRDPRSRTTRKLTTAHEHETSRARRQDVQTAPCAQAQRAVVTDSQERPSSVAVFPITKDRPELYVFRPRLYSAVYLRRFHVGFISVTIRFIPQFCVRGPLIVTKRNSQSRSLSSGPPLRGPSYRRGSN